MRTKDIISDKIPTVCSECAASNSLAIMTEHGINALPITDEDIYKGIIFKKDLCKITDKNASIQPIIKDFPGISSEAHILEAVERLSQSNEPILPVISPENHYIGTVTAQTVLSGITKLCNTAHTGSIIEMEMFPEDYSITELSRIVEDNRCKVINLFTFPNDMTGRLKVQIRINSEDASAVLQSLERFNYRVTAIYRPEGKLDARTQQRLRELLYYLEM